MRLRATRLTAIAHAARRLLGAAWSPRNWFMSGEQGAWYDPTDLVRYMSPGPELVVNGGFSSATGWTPGPGWTISGGVASFSGGTNGISQSITLTPGARYTIQFTVLGLTGGYVYPRFTGGSVVNGTSVFSNSTVTQIITAASGNDAISFVCDAGPLSIDNISVREIPLISQATMYQDAAGTTPVTAVEQPVGLILDRRMGALGALGTELNTGTPIPYTGNGTVSVAGDVITATCTANGGYGITWSSSVVSGVQVRMSLEVVTNSAAKNILAYANLAHPGISIGSTTGNKSIITFAAVASGSSRQPALILFGGVAGESFSVRVVSIREVPGNHASQATSTARPTLRNRVNLLTFTEQFDNAAWTKSAATVAANSVTDPLGGMTADSITFTNGGAGSQLWWTSPVFSGSLVAGIWLRADTPVTMEFGFFDSGASTMTVINLTTSWQWFSTTRASGLVGGDRRACWLYKGSAGGVTVHAWGASLVSAADASLPYQRVNTATDYDSDPSKFPLYLAFDGSDDSMATGSIDFSATDEMTVVAGVTKLSDAAVGMIAETSTGTAAGSFAVYNETASIGYNALLTGSQILTAKWRTYAAPRKDVLGFQFDIGQSTAAAECAARLNGSALTISETSGTDAGSGNFGNHALFIGSRGGSSLRFNGRIHQLIIRGKTSADIAQAESFVAARTGVVI